jgi:hypothetical protein
MNPHILLLAATIGHRSIDLSRGLWVHACNSPSLCRRRHSSQIAMPLPINRPPTSFSVWPTNRRRVS